MDTIRKIFRLSNIGTIIFCTLNLGIILGILTNGFRDTFLIPYIIGVYLLTLLFSLSPIGEFFFAYMIGARKMKRKDMKLKMVPLLQTIQITMTEFIDCKYLD